MPLTRDQIYTIVRETVAGFGSLPTEWTHEDFEKMKLSDLRLDATNVTSKVGQKDFFQRLQTKFRTKEYQLELTTNEIFEDPAIKTMADLIYICSENLSPL